MAVLQELVNLLVCLLAQVAPTRLSDSFTTNYTSSTVPPPDTLLSIIDFVNGNCCTLQPRASFVNYLMTAHQRVSYETVVNDPLSSEVRHSTSISLLDSVWPEESSVNKKEEQHLMRVVS